MKKAREWVEFSFLYFMISCLPVKNFTIHEPTFKI